MKNFINAAALALEGWIYDGRLISSDPVIRQARPRQVESFAIRNKGYRYKARGFRVSAEN